MLQIMSEPCRLDSYVLFKDYDGAIHVTMEWAEAMLLGIEVEFLKRRHEMDNGILLDADPMRPLPVVLFARNWPGPHSWAIPNLQAHVLCWCHLEEGVSLMQIQGLTRKCLLVLATDLVGLMFFRLGHAWHEPSCVELSQTASRLTLLTLILRRKIYLLIIMMS